MGLLWPKSGQTLFAIVGASLYLAGCTSDGSEVDEFFAEELAASAAANGTTTATTTTTTVTASTLTRNCKKLWI
jgi:outer membrane murein-binding lipoprotein Lpp